jgi:hypothetical protein
MVAAHDVTRAAELAPTRPPPGAGSIAEFLLVGGVTPFLFALSWWLRKAFGLDGPELAFGFLTFHAAFVINDPHFAVTYCLFYRRFASRLRDSTSSPWQRVRYVAAGIVAPLGLAAWTVAALATKSALALGLFIQLMFFLVGWHYVKQGFGVMLVLSARRGVRFGARERMAILAHCRAGWAYAWASPADTGTEVEEKGVVFTTLARPVWLERFTHAVFLATACALVWVLVQKIRREGRLPLLTPLAALLLSIWSWSIYSSIDPLVVYVIPALHSVQYLYFVWLLRAGEAREREGPPWFERAASVRLAALAASALALGWLLFHGAPTALDDLLVPRHPRASDAALGPTPYFAALYTFVNIHHFAMDSVIWRRENPETSYLAGKMPIRS